MPEPSRAVELSIGDALDQVERKRRELAVDCLEDKALAAERTRKKLIAKRGSRFPDVIVGDLVQVELPPAQVRGKQELAGVYGKPIYEVTGVLDRAVYLADRNGSSDIPMKNPVSLDRGSA